MILGYTKYYLNYYFYGKTNKLRTTVILMNFKSNSSLIGNILFFLILFFYIYSPLIGFLPINTSSLIGIFSLLYLLNIKLELLIWFIKKNLILITLFILIIMYSIILDVFVQQSIKTYSPFIKNFRIFIEGFLPALIIGNILIKKNYSLLSLFKVLIIFTIFQFVIALFMFNIHIKVFLFNDFMKYPLDSQIFIPQHFLTRGFGFSENYLFSFPFVQGFIAVVGLIIYKDLKGIQKFNVLLGVVFSIILVMLNARIGMVPILVFLIVSIFFYFYRYLEIYISIIILLFIITINYNFNKENNFNLHIDKILISYNATKELIINGKKTDTYSDLFSDSFWELPENEMDFIFGSGNVLTPDQKIYSDVGYIRNIHYGGILYCIIFYTFFIIIFYKMYKNSNTVKLKFLSIIFFISFFIGEIKGNMFALNETTKLLFLILVFMQLNNNYLKFKLTNNKYK